MTKLTTEEFIKKAQALHGDRYDYSKVEYENTSKKICIICKEHGEFWQTPYSHLNGHGCSKCSTERNSEKLLLWTREHCYFEAQKYLSRSAFKEGCPYGYSSARKHGWLDDYTWFRPARKQVSAGYWTYDRCFEEARKYRSLKEFEENANGARQYAAKMGWIKDYTWFDKPFRWTKELCEKEARKYATKLDFYTASKNAYAAAVKHGWLDSFTWLESIVRPNGYWTRQRCENEARKYNSKKDFKEGNPAAHAAAFKHGWLNEFDWLIDQRIDIIKGKIDSVYVYIFEETKTAYVGRTLMRRQKKRDKEHIYNVDSDNVARYAKKINVPVPQMIILESELTIEEGLDREDYWRKWYEQNGYTMLNRLATGIGKGSLGAISQGKWNKKACFEEAKKYNSAHEFEKANGSAYDAARRNGWIREYTWFEVLWEPKWDKDSCYQEAKRYKTRGEFQKGSPSAYNIAHRRKWIEDYDWLVSRIKYPKGYWDDYDRCYQEAKQYVSRIGLQNGNKNAYESARKHGWLDDYDWFKEKAKNNYWNRETCFEEAKKYKRVVEFARNAVRAYELSRTKGWIKDYTWFDKPFRWTKELCEKEARKYKKRSHFKANSPGAYTKARENGWLDDYTWFDKKPRINYWNQETCFEEAEKYKTITEFQKGAAGAYQKALKNGWLDDYTWMKQYIRSWSYEACKLEASKYESKVQFKNAMPGAYKKAREKGWIDIFFPVSLRRKLDYETCKQSVTQYQDIRDLRKADRSLYKTLKEKGWLDEFFPKMKDQYE